MLRVRAVAAESPDRPNPWIGATASPQRNLRSGVTRRARPPRRGRLECADRPASRRRPRPRPDHRPVVARLAGRARPLAVVRPGGRRAGDHRRRQRRPDRRPGTVGPAGRRRRREQVDERGQVRGDHRRAAGHRLEQDDAETLPRPVRGDEYVGGAEQPGPFGVADHADTATARRQRPGAATGAPRADCPAMTTSRRRCRGPGAGPDRRQRRQQHVESLARFVEPAQERQPGTITAAPGPWCGSGGSREFGVAEAVGDDDRVPAEVAHDDLPGRLRDGDPGVDLADRAAQHAAGQPHRPRSRASRCGTSRRPAPCPPTARASDARGDRLVQVQQVEVAVPQPAAAPARR